MLEIKGNLWNYYGQPNVVVCITTNGFIKKNGEAVMGRGCALEATRLYPELPKLLGDHLKSMGNFPHLFEFERGGLISFPVKHNWWENADLNLIQLSAGYLSGLAGIKSNTAFILPRPGCGNGHLSWEEVKPVIEFLPNNVWVISNEI